MAEKQCEMSEVKMNSHQRIIIYAFFFSLIIGLSVSGNASIATVITISVEADSYVDSDKTNSNFGEDDYIKVANFEINQTNITKTGLLRFSLTELQDIDIDSVFLELYVVILTVRHKIGVYKSSDVSWNELTVTHNTRPSYNDTVLDTALVGPDPGEWYSWSVTEAVNDSVAAGQITFVIKVEKLYESTDCVWFFSKDGELKEGYSPRLSVNYTEPKASSGPNYLIILISLFPLLLKKQQRNKGE